MGKVQIYACDCPGCSVTERNASDWYIYLKLKAFVTFLPLTGNTRFLDSPLAGGEVGALCSKQCAQRVLERFLASFDEPKSLVLQAETDLLISELINKDKGKEKNDTP